MAVKFRYRNAEMAIRRPPTAQANFFAAARKFILVMR